MHVYAHYLHVYTRVRTQADKISDPELMQRVYKRISLENMGSVEFYTSALLHASPSFSLSALEMSG